jgi:hypothetical protein
MAMGSIVELGQIPYLDLSEGHGRFISTLSFYEDGEWKIWLPIGEGKFIQTTGWPAEGFYYASAPENNTDIYLHFLDFISQRGSFLEIQKAFLGIRDDFFNLSASLSKVTHIHETRSMLGTGDGRMIVTELEYFFSICRSMLDLLQEVAVELWKKITLLDSAAPTKQGLRESFNSMVWFNGRKTTRDELQSRFGLPEPLADFYIRHVDFFLLVKNFRDNIIHNGSQIQTIFSAEDGYLINRNFRPFSSLEIWKEEEFRENELVPLLPALGVVAYKTLGICEDFTTTLEKIIQFPKPLVPNKMLFMRGYFDGHFGWVLKDAQRRVSGQS